VTVDKLAQGGLLSLWFLLLYKYLIKFGDLVVPILKVAHHLLRVSVCIPAHQALHIICTCVIMYVRI